MNPFRTLLSLALMACSAGLAMAACDGDNQDTLCNPGDNIFCRCKGGEAGTKACSSDGSQFGPCEPCEDRPDPTTASPSSNSVSTGSTTSTSSSSTGAGGAGTGGGGPVGDGVLFDTCLSGDQCASGVCIGGYCTITGCTSYADCGGLDVGECINFGGQTQCSPVCSSQADCEPFGCGALCSACGYTLEVQANYPVTTCADWGNDLQLYPEGTECTNDVECNLGHQGMEFVCHTFGTCNVGCYTADDCPTNFTCSSQGAIGNCVAGG